MKQLNGLSSRGPIPYILPMYEPSQILVYLSGASPKDLFKHVFIDFVQLGSCYLFIFNHIIYFLKKYTIDYSSFICSISNGVAFETDVLCTSACTTCILYIKSNLKSIMFSFSSTYNPTFNDV